MTNVAKPEAKDFPDWLESCDRMQTLAGEGSRLVAVGWVRPVLPGVNEAKLLK